MAYPVQRARGLGKGVSGKPYPHMCNARKPQLEPGTFRSQAVRLYRLHQARPSYYTNMILLNNKLCYHLLPDTVTECLYNPPDGRIVMVFV